MKTWITVFVALFLATAATQAADFGVFGSHWDPRDGDKALGVGGSAHFSTVPLELRVTVYPDTSIKGGGDSWLMPIDFGLAVSLTRAHRFGIYVGGGVSHYIIDADHGNPDNEFGWYVLARLEVPIEHRLSVFVEAMHRRVEFDDIDADLRGATFNVGLIFR